MRVVVDRSDKDRTVRLALLGEVRAAAAGTVRSALLQEVELIPARLFVDLGAVDRIDFEVLTALMAGYIAAIDHGVSYQVVGVHGQVRRVLERWAILDVLADSDDIGALIVAYCRLPSIGLGDVLG